jgi:hypothetical protein
LQQNIEGEMKDVKPDIDPEKWIGDSEGPAVTKAEVGIPFGVETTRDLSVLTRHRIDQCVASAGVERSVRSITAAI